MGFVVIVVAAPAIVLASIICAVEVFLLPERPRMNRLDSSTTIHDIDVSGVDHHLGRRRIRLTEQVEDGIGDSDPGDTAFESGIQTGQTFLLEDLHGRLQGGLHMKRLWLNMVILRSLTPCHRTHGIRLFRSDG